MKLIPRLDLVIVSVRQRGGLFGVDRTIKVDRRRLSIREQGRRNHSEITEQQAAHLRHLVSQVEEAATGSDATARSGPDEMRTEVTIRRPGAALRLTAHDESPTVVWDLVGALADVADTLEPGI